MNLSALAAGLIIPGAAYWLTGRRIQAIFFLVSVTVLCLGGFALGGSNLWPEPRELEGLDGLMLALIRGGAAVKWAAGLPFLLVTWMGYSQPVIAGFTHDYGTKMLILAGLLNVFALADSWESLQPAKSKEAAKK
jgi:hypothetical protein